MKRKSVLIGLSGGVDSAVAALLLKKQGYEVIGAFMKNFSENKNKITGECHWIEDKKDAEKIAALLEIPLIILNFENEYRREVIDPMFSDFTRGLTPNPDINCNRYIKFPLLWKEAKKRKIDCIATGHYARITKNKGNYELHQAKDKEKDQTYFLYGIDKNLLKQVMFPLGNYTKKETREIARKNNIPVHMKRGSRGICFVGKMSLKKLLSQKIKEKTGKILNMNGEIIGKHQGISFYTIGERLRSQKGAMIQMKKLSRDRIYVAKKDQKTNTLWAVTQNSPVLKKTNLTVKNLRLLEDKLPSKVKIRTRHRGQLIEGKIKKIENKIICDLKKPAILAPGQSAVFYKGSKVIGGGEIIE